MPKGKTRTQKELEERRYEIAFAAADLIFEKGFNQTSVKQIARAAGIGKSTLYDFFSTKDEIILFLMDKPLSEITSRARKIIASKDSVVNRLYRVMHMHLDILIRDKAFIFKLSLEAQWLNAELQKQHQVKRHAYQDLIVGLVEEGIANGCFRAVDPNMVMKTLISIMGSVVITSRPVGTPQEMLDKTLELILNGIQC